MTNPTAIVLADDDIDDRAMSREAVAASSIENEFHTVNDGEELIEFLQRRGRYAGSRIPRPGIILLDLNMPRMDGREVLGIIKKDPELRQIPVVIMTTSRAERDVFQSYDLGANSFITKPGTFEELVDIMNRLDSWWLRTVALPESN